MKVLLASYGGGHINMILPVYKKLKRLGNDVQVFGFTMAQPILERENIDFLSFRNFRHLISDEAVSFGKDICAGFEAHPDISEEETCLYMGLGFEGLVRNYGKKEAQKIFKKKGRSEFMFIDFSKKVLKEVKPDVVISTNSPRMEKSLFIATKSEEIPSYCIVDFYDEEEVRDRLGDPDYCSKIFVSLPKIKELLLHSGWKNEDVILSGNPAFDDIFDSSYAKAAEKLKAKWGLSNKKNILFARNYSELTKEDEDIVQEKLEELCGKFNIIIRHHPNDPRTEISPQKEVYVSGLDDHLYTVLNLADIVIVENSTVGLEACLMGKEVHQISFQSYPHKVAMEELGIAKEYRNIESMMKYLNNYKMSKNKEYPKMQDSAVDIIINEIQGDLM